MVSENVFSGSKDISQDRLGQRLYRISTQNMKRLYRWVGVTVALLLTAYFIYFVTTTFRQYDLAALLAPKLMLAIGIAALLYVFIIPVSGWAWAVLLRSMGITWSTANLAAIMGFSQLAKYIPGNIGQHIGRTTLALAKGMPTGGYIASVFVETVLAITAGLSTGLACLLFSPVQASSIPVEYQNSLRLFAVGLTVGILGLLLLLKYLPLLLKRTSLAQRWLNIAFAPPTLGATATAFVAYCANYLLIGLGLYFIAIATDAWIQADYLYLTAAFALSWLLGFLTPGAPAGLGVREGAMVLLLSNLAQKDTVLVVIVAMRVATIIGDSICFAVSAWYLRCVGRESGNECRT